MNTNDIKSVFNSITPIPDGIWEEFEQYFTEKSLNKEEILWETGSVCKHLIFIKKGIIRIYDTQTDKENTVEFIFEGNLLTDYLSFTQQIPTYYAYKAIEACELIAIPRIVVYNMYDKYKEFERIGRIIAEQNFIKVVEVRHRNKTLSPEEKYSILLKERPKVISRIPIKFIASYLGMTPEHLSRIRKKIVNK